MKKDFLDLRIILQNVPYHLKLYSPAYGNVYLEQIDDLGNGFKATPMIICKTLSGNIKKFFVDGTLSANGECMLFPSSEHRTWDDFKN